MHVRTVLLLGALMLFTGWYLRSVAGPAPAQPAADRSADPRDAPPAVEAPTYAEQLRIRLDRLPPSPRPVRNPFAFGTARPASAGGASRTPEEEEEPPAVVPEVRRGPAFVLSGVATQLVDGAAEHTGIVRSGSGLHFVMPGDTLPGGFIVVSVTDSMVIVRDDMGVEQTLRLP